MKKGFTLAEVLITLTIVGLVAVIILPAFTKNMSQNNFNRLKSQFDAKLVEATRQMNIQDGVAPYSDTVSFVNKFKKYVKFPEICSSDKLASCFGNYKITQNEEEFNVEDLKTSKEFGKDYNVANVGVTILDGMYFIISYNPDCEPIDAYSYSPDKSDTTGCISYLIDVNGKKKPNTIGKDVFPVGVVLSKSVPTKKIPCISYESWSPCRSSELEVAMIDAVVAEYLGTSTGSGYNGYYSATANGAQMTWGLANKVCADMGMRLPSTSELKSMHTYSNIVGGYAKAEYWADGQGNWGIDYRMNCNMAYGNCGQEYYTTKRYARCVK